MLPRLVAGALVATALVFAHGDGGALADEPPRPAAPVLDGGAAPRPPAPAPSQAPAVPPAPSSAPTTPPPAPTPPPQAQPHGAVVVATSEGAGPAARALAFDVYRDPELRPSVDDTTARVLAGEAPAEGATARLKEIAELRLSVAHAGSELVARRLLASLGTELGAALVISVAMDGTRPVARALRPATAAFERVELGPTVETAPDGVRTFRWPGATATLRGFLPGAKPPPAPLAPKVETATAPAAPAEPRPFYKSPWFWGSVGGAAAIGLSVFLISRATSTPSDVHLMGKVGP